jgi:hypothetical protein
MRTLLAIAACAILGVTTSCITKAPPARRYILLPKNHGAASNAATVSVTEVRLPTYLDDNGMHLMRQDGELLTVPGVNWGARLSQQIRDALQTELRSLATAASSPRTLRLEFQQCCVDTDGVLHASGIATIQPGGRTHIFNYTSGDQPTGKTDAPAIRLLHQELVANLAQSLVPLLK